MPASGLPTTRLALLMVPLAAIVAALLMLVSASMEIMSAGRAYVGGEGLWSKGQKDAVQHLLRYARTFDEAHYRRYREAIAVPLGDRKAREALDAPQPDYAAARAGFIEGRNHPDDVEAMARLFVRFRDFTHVARAIDIWAAGDRLITRLQVVAERLHAEIAAGRRDAERIDPLLEEIAAIDAALQPLEDAFSYTLGEATRWMRSTLQLLVLGAAILLVVVAAFVSRRQLRRADAAEEALRESEARLRLVANSVPALISYIDRGQRYRFANRTYEEWFGIPHESMLGRTVREVFGEETYAGLRAQIERALGGERVEFENVNAEGASRRTLQVAYVPHLDPVGEVLGFYVLASDVSALKLAQEELRTAAEELERNAARLEYMAHHDNLTALPNRSMLQERLQRAISAARRREEQLALLFVDLDHFKHVNDSLGHGAGDALLMAVATRFRDCVRQEDLVARLGGDEFCVLLEGIAAPADAGAVAQKLLAALARPYRVGDQELYIAASIGIACLPQDGLDMEALLKNADIAMYRAKELGRNNYQYYAAEPGRGNISALAVAGRLREALARGELELYYQPRVDAPTGRVVAVEALLRWNHPVRGLLLPGEFVPLAEAHGLIVPIGEWVLREACSQARRWTVAGWGRIAVSVNLSMRQLRHPDLVEQVRAALEGNALPPWRLELEITESMAMQAPEETARQLRELAQLGVRLSLDDFGTGHSALHYLKRFPVNVLKIDQTFVAGLPADRHDAAIAHAIADIARGLDLQVVAEGVERPEQRDFLLGVGCRLCQGSLFGDAVPAEAMEVRLSAGVAV